MIEMLLKGGLLIWPILFCSVIAFAIFLEKLYSLQRSKVVPDELFSRILELVNEEKYSEAKVLCEARPTAMGKICLAGISHKGKSRDVIKAVFEEVGKQEGRKLFMMTGVIGTIASISPLLGLLGTVVGMIKVFQVISIEGVGNAASLSGGISEALLTTAAGLLVAIPTLIMYRFIKSKIGAIISELEEKSVLLLDALVS